MTPLVSLLLPDRAFTGWGGGEGGWLTAGFEGLAVQGGVWMGLDEESIFTSKRQKHTKKNRTLVSGEEFLVDLERPHSIKIRLDTNTACLSCATFLK